MTPPDLVQHRVQLAQQIRKTVSVLLLGNEVTKFLSTRCFETSSNIPWFSLLGSVVDGVAILSYFLMKLTNVVVQRISQLHA